jgi:ceramide glucosyltransferase
MGRELLTFLRAGVLAAALAASLVSLSYLAACVVVSWAWRRRARQITRDRVATSSIGLPSVTVLKPLCGLEPGLEANLRSFCAQEYPSYEVVMGSRDHDDPALELARAIAGSAQCKIDVVAGAQTLGPNLKVSTLARLGASSRSDVIVIADSDIGVGPGYLRAVVEPLTDPEVGVVTCLYRGQPTDSFWSRLGALSINEWFRPSVLISRLLGSETYCSGATIACRREVLDAIGGFRDLASLLADDHELGARVRRLGLRCVLSDYEVTTTVDEPTVEALVQHELRWARTIRAVQPHGHASLGITYAVPLTLLTALADPRPLVMLLPALAVLLRVSLHWVVDAGRSASAEAAGARTAPIGGGWLVPFRDVLSFGVWMASFATRQVTWRQQRMYVRRDGVLHEGKEAISA